MAIFVNSVFSGSLSFFVQNRQYVSHSQLVHQPKINHRVVPSISFSKFANLFLKQSIFSTWSFYLLHLQTNCFSFNYPYCKKAASYFDFDFI